MFRLDESLAAVFRKRLKSAKGKKAELSESARQFRAKCFDLLLIALAHQSARFKPVVKFVHYKHFISKRPNCSKAQSLQKKWAKIIMLL